MLRVSKKREVLYPVRVRQLKEDGSGEIGYAEIKIRYRLMTKTEMQTRVRETIEEADGLAAREALRHSYDAKRLNEYQQFVMDHVTGWEGVVDADTGEEIPFSRERLKALMDDSSSFHEAVEESLWTASREEPVKN